MDEQMAREAKKRALSLDISLSEFVCRAVEQALASTPASVKPYVFRMPTYGLPANNAEKVRHEPGDFAAAVEADDVAMIRR